MNNMWVISSIVIGMLILERIVVLSATRCTVTKGWIRKFPPFHPNGISIMRLPMGAVSIWIASRGNWPVATLWFAFWMITDLSDGTIARHCDLGTEMGKWLDPLSDKCMYFPALLFFCFSSSVNPQLDPIPVIAFIIIDIIGQASRLFSKKKAANLFGKAKTALVTILLSLVALNQIDSIVVINKPFVDAMMYTCLILAFLSCYCKIIPDNWYANTFTLANFLCGLGGIFYAWKGMYIHCMVLVFVGQFFDLFDGRLARKYGSTKRGAMFDDIADATSFGVAIGSMVFFCLKNETSLVLALSVSIFYIGCLFYRLYRFLKPTRPMPKGVFQGLPSPAGAMFAGASVLVSQEFSHPAAAIGASILVAAAALLMISNIPYCHFGQTIWPSTPKAIKLLFFIMFTILTVFAIVQKNYRPSFVWCCFGFTIFYLVYGIHWINRLPPAGQSKKQQEE